ncbi:pectate lyase [Marinimicrobium alkaliphilum]|uniref:pectate lyase n=1 Tax=Marinimicrobium alkaliphilum TaxID=2202654 RepID=UPI000DBA8F63|nr:pectate lyase [Marinimicrobium alkaliphilum]
MLRDFPAFRATAAGFFGVALLSGCTMSQPIYSEIALDDFGDAIKHWEDQQRDDEAGHYDANQIIEIADNILLYQRANGGWPVNRHPTRKINEAERAQILAEKPFLDGSFDNRNTYPQVEYLSWVYLQTGDIRYRQGALDGLRFTLEAQYDNGGFAHSPYRTEQSYYQHITFADDIMPGVLGFLRAVALGMHPYGYVPMALREQAAEAVAKGNALILELQVRQGDRPTVWAGQYHKDTLEPTTGRPYEVPALASWESVAVVEYLMGIEDPPGPVIGAIESAVDWFERVRFDGMALVEEPLRAPVEYRFHVATHDRVLAESPDAGPVWARFYDLDTNKAVFANRDGFRVPKLADVHLERRTGYDWYGRWPEKLVNEDYPQWQERVYSPQGGAGHVERY